MVWPTFQGKILSFTNDDKQKECLEGLNQDNIDQVFNCPMEENSDHFTILENGGVLFNKLTPEIVRAISEQLYSGREVNIDEPCILTFYGSLRFETPFGQTVSIMGRGPDYINSPRIDKHLERWVTQVDFLTGLTHFYTNFPNLVGAASIAIIAAVSLSALVYLIKLLFRCRKTKKYHEKKYVNFVRRYNRERDEKIKQQLRPMLKR